MGLGYEPLMRRHPLTLLALAIAAATLAAGAAASAPPGGMLPPGRTVAYRTTPDRVVSFTLPAPTIKGGVWRIARAFDPAVVTEKGERTLADGTVRITLKTTGPGTTRVVFALTKGEGARAWASR